MNNRGGTDVVSFGLTILATAIVFIICVHVLSAFLVKPDRYRANVLLYTCSGTLLHVWEGVTVTEGETRTFTAVEGALPTTVSGGVMVIDSTLTELDKPKRKRGRQ